MKRIADAYRLPDAARGVLIAVISVFVGYAVLQPVDPSVRAPPSSGSLKMLGIALLLQVGMLLGNWLVGRYERAHGLEGQLAPTARHILGLVADGVSVLLFALAVFGGIAGAALSI
jgi:hypothetical protein